MIRRKSAYFDDFRCLAGSCPDSCCQEWDVDVDETSAQRYLALPGQLGDRLREKLKHGPDGSCYLEITDRRCPMWRADGLCQIQVELGHDGLCQVCQRFPRLTHDYGDFAEHGLELSCPEAARLILTAPGRFLEEEVPGGDQPGYDEHDMAVLLRTRNEALALLDGRDVRQTLALLLLYSYHAQLQLDGGEEVSFDIESALTFTQGLEGPGGAELLIQIHQGLEILTPRWSQRLQVMDPHWPEELRAMARYGVERYWLQAVSDWDIVSRARLTVAGCVLVGLLGGDVIETAQLWSKEIENSPENMDAILDGIYLDRGLTDEKLLALLL